MTTIVTLPGDGIGPEVMDAAARLLERVGEFDLQEHPIGGASIDAHGTALTDEVVEHFADDPTLDYIRLNIDARRPE